MWKVRRRKFEDHIKIISTLLTLFPVIFWETLLTRIYLNSWQSENAANRFLNVYKNFGRLPRHFFRRSVDRTGIVESKLRVNVAKNHQLSRYTLVTNKDYLGTYLWPADEEMKLWSHNSLCRYTHSTYTSVTGAGYFVLLFFILPQRANGLTRARAPSRNGR